MNQSIFVEKGSFLARLVQANEPYLVKEPGLLFYAAAEAVALVGSLESLHHVCHITLRKSDGRIFVQAPYLPRSEAVAGVLKWTQPKSGSVTLAFEPGSARTTSRRIKLDHPPDGRAHLSGSGVQTEFWTESFVLDGPGGHVFELLVVGVPDHRAVKPDAILKRRRVHLPFFFAAGMPEAVSLFGDWVLKDRLRSGIVGELAGPRGTMRDSAGNTFPCFYLGQPAESPLQKHVLRITAGPALKPAGDALHGIVLRGGWSPMGSAKPGEEKKCLAFMSPLADFAALTKRLGTMHYDPAVDA